MNENENAAAPMLNAVRKLTVEEFEAFLGWLDRTPCFLTPMWEEFGRMYPQRMKAINLELDKLARSTRGHA